MDLAKITAVILAHGGAIRDYVGDDKIPGPVFPVICVPTTAGTGSEVSAASVLTDTDNQMKVGVLSNYLRPTVALVDPLMSSGCPSKVTADSGIDALTHAIEAYTAVDNAAFPLPPGERTVYQGKHPMGDAMAEKAITLVGQFLRRAVKKGDDLEAREGMALAATLAGLAFSNVGVAAVHALEYPIGGALHCSHGAGNGLLLPYVMRFNLPAQASVRGHRTAAGGRRQQVIGGAGGRAGHRRRGPAARGYRHSPAAPRSRRQGNAASRLRRKGDRDQAHPARQSTTRDCRGFGRHLQAGVLEHSVSETTNPTGGDRWVGANKVSRGPICNGRFRLPGWDFSC